MGASLFLTVVLSATSPQSPDGISLGGIVVDVHDAVVPAATVSVSCDGVRREAQSDGAGRFRLTGLPPAACLVSAERGLLASGLRGVNLSDGPVDDLRLTLAVAGVQSEVTVTPARGSLEAVRSVPESVSVVSPRDIETRPHQVMPQVLGEEPGVLVQQTTSAQASPFLRGFTGQGNVYLVDGARFNTAAWRSGPSQYLAWLSDAGLDRIEIVRGAGSVQYGSDALGGTVHVVSDVPSLADGRTRLEAAGAFAASTVDASAGGDAWFGVRAPAVAFTAGGGAKTVGDLRPGRAIDSHAVVTRYLGLPSSVVSDDLEATGFDQTGLRAALHAQPGDGSAVSVTWRRDEQTGARRYDRELGGDGWYRSVFDPQVLDFFTARYQRARTGPFDALAAGFSINRQQDGQWEQRRPGAAVNRLEQRTTAYGYQAQATKVFAGRHTTVFGGEAYDEHIGGAREVVAGGVATPARPDIPDGTRYTSVGLFVQDTADLVPDRLTVRGGFRYGRFSFSTTADERFGVVAESVVSDALTWHAGAVVGLGRGWSASFTASRAFRAANAFDLGAIGLTGEGGFEISPGEAIDLGGFVGTSASPTAVNTGEPVGALGPEVVYEYEASLRYVAGPVSASVTAYDLEVSDSIQRRTLVFTESIVGQVVSGYEVVAQDAEGRAYIAEDPRPMVTRVNVSRARIQGFEADGSVRLARGWTARAFFALTNGRELDSSAYLRRMPPPLGQLSVRWQPPAGRVWAAVVATFARAQTRLSPGDLGDPRIGGRRTPATIASYFNGGAVDLGLVKDGVLVPTGESLEEVQARVLGDEPVGYLFTSTPGFFVLGLRGGWQPADRLGVDLALENLTDRNYRIHGSGVDGAGWNATARVRVGW